VENFISYSEERELIEDIGEEESGEENMWN
jgi:hypothetical protein